MKIIAPSGAEAQCEPEAREALHEARWRAMHRQGEREGYYEVVALMLMAALFFF